MADIVNLKKVITIGAKLGNVAGKIYEDKVIDAKDLVAIPELVMIVPAFLDVKYNELLPEGKDLDNTEIAEILAHFNSEFDIPQDALETNIEKVLALVYKIY